MTNITEVNNLGDIIFPSMNKFGGGCQDRDNDGLFFCRLYFAVVGAGWGIGSRLHMIG